MYKKTKRMLMYVLVVASVNFHLFAVAPNESRFLTHDYRTKAAKASSKLSPQKAMLKEVKQLRQENLRLKRQINTQNTVIKHLKKLLTKNGIMVPAALSKLKLPKDYLVPNSDGIAHNFRYPLSLGQKAYTGTDRRVRVEQVIDKSNALVTLNLTFSSRITPPDTSPLVWLAGVSTKDMVDGSGAKIEMPLEVTGTKMYTTALGTSKTVYCLEPIKEKSASNGK